MKMFNWVALFAVFLILVSAPQSNPIEEISTNIIIENGFDALQTSIENTGSDFWSEATFDTYILVACPYEVNTFKLPQIDRLNYELFTFDTHYRYWDKRIHVSKNNFIA